MKLNKLVRDNIPNIIRSNGSTPITHIADDKEYKEKLREKLSEEITKFLESESPEELADILEVIYAISDIKGINKKDLEEIRVKKQ